MTLRVITVAWTLAVAVGLYLFFRSSDSEVLIARSASLTTDWTELRPQSAMRTSGDWSELYVEMLDVHEGADGTYAFEDGSRLSLQGYLISESGEKLDLDADLQVGGLGPTQLARLSNSSLEWKRRDYKFRSLVLRTSRALKVGRIVWISYDPQSTKTGVKIPDTFSPN